MACQRKCEQGVGSSLLAGLDASDETKHEMGVGWWIRSNKLGVSSSLPNYCRPPQLHENFTFRPPQPTFLSFFINSIPRTPGMQYFYLTLYPNSPPSRMMTRAHLARVSSVGVLVSFLDPGAVDRRSLMKTLATLLLFV